jgi:hypothetical protein
MKKIVLCMLVFITSALAEVDKAQLDLFKKESAALRLAIDEVVNASVSGRGSAESAKATYLEGYGALFMLEATLEPTRNPFQSVKTPDEVKKIVAERRKTIETKLEALLKQRVATLQSVGPTDSVTVVLYLFNSNPVDVPDLPSQIVFTVKKQDPARVNILAF